MVLVLLESFCAFLADGEQKVDWLDVMVIIGQWSSKSTFGANNLASEAKRKKRCLRQNGANHLGAGNKIVRMSFTFIVVVQVH